MNKAERIINMLNLQPHPEGGFYSESYRSVASIPADTLEEKYGGPRAFSTAIYYLLTPGTFSTMHRVKSDELFHFYDGDPVEMLQLEPSGTGQIITLGTDIENDMLPQVVVPAGVWQGCRLIPGGDYALMGTTVAPGFDFEDYEAGNRITLVDEYPVFRDMINNLTR